MPLSSAVARNNTLTATPNSSTSVGLEARTAARKNVSASTLTSSTMSQLSRGVRAASRSTKRLINHQARRFDSHHAPHGSSESALHVAGGTGNESMGKGIFVAVALVPVSMVAYSLIASDENNFIVRTINAYKFREETWDRRNTLHEAALRQAAHDRNLLMNQPMDQSGPDLGFPEQFNSSSPWNVVAGEGGADLRQLTEHYRKKEEKIEGARKARMVDGKVMTVYDDTTSGRFKGFPFSSK